jgi:hypothetical protein
MTLMQNALFSVLLFGALECLYWWTLRKQQRHASSLAA